MRHQALARARTFGPCSCAIAAVEFAIVFPILISMIAMAFELYRYVQVARQITTYADEAATMLATNTTGTVSYTDLHYAADAAMITAPIVLSDSYLKGISWSKDITIGLAGVSFTPKVTGCTSGCTYNANIVWTGSSKTRACGTNPTSTSDQSAPSPSTLPSDLFDPVTTPTGSSPPLFEIVVDVDYTWRPLLFSQFFASQTIVRSAYLSPRYVSQITYQKVTGDDGFGGECPGF